ncbi:hypothetical protein A2693_03650 [Candidatus Curtissbacteria bacterium RIFCSPHIGHO2_01_FULL_40_12]|uniref:Uncharacterized protein n=1 Tax=Candidatus Curtissbacteria bacterium RIFCSPHIGHO2_01_FULL_40_12 TaxID=1797710 RepID=A0A1F5G9M8_9BACT|nr:MAG: hypothetical protein A2693_03650 [Candidatus Curtissbacteria bacterium RIFCSPHIGHO2_01_FULL_40_12]
MKDEQTGLMEEEILKEEEKFATPMQPDNKEDKIKSKRAPIRLYDLAKKAALSIKRPKIITLFLLFAIILAIYTALALLASKRQPEEITQTTIETSSPSPEVVTDPALIKIANDIDNFKLELDKQEGFSSDLFPPILDLEISFK